MERCLELLHANLFAASEEIQLIVKQMMICLLRSARQAPRQGDPEKAKAVSRVCAHIRQHPSQRLNIAELAVLTGMPQRSFVSLFKLITGKTPELYMIVARLERAEQLLRNSDMTVSEVAEALGYQNIFLFSRQFRKHKGKTPVSVKQERRSG